MTENRREFLLLEYSALRQEIQETLKDLPSNEKFGLIFNGAYWGWLLTNVVNPMYLYVAVWVPGVLTILFALRARALGKKFYDFHNYILKIEREFDLGELGWEKHLDTRETGWFKIYSNAFWPALILGNVLAGIMLLSIE